MSIPQGEVVEPATQQEEAIAWIDAVLRIGDDVGTMARTARAQARREVLPMAPVFASQVVPASGTVTLDLGTPARGKMWEVRGLACVDANNPAGVTTGGTVVTGANTYAAAAGGNTGIAAGSSMTGFDITVGPVAAAVTGAVTVLNLQGGTLTYELTEQVAGTTLSVRFPTPIPAVSPGSFPQVSMPAIASGGVSAVNVYGLSATANATPGAGFWYTGIPQVFGAQNARWQIPSLPTIDTKGGQHIVVPTGEHLFAVLTGCTPGHLIVARADVIEDSPAHVNVVQAI